MSFDNSCQIPGRFSLLKLCIHVKSINGSANSVMSPDCIGI